MIQTAEGALSETQDILQRMRELATQAANDTNTDSDRGEIQKEMNQLTSEINRIGNTTEFNTQKLLNGGSDSTSPTQNTVAVGNGLKVPTGLTGGTGSTEQLASSTITFKNTPADAGDVDGESFKLNIGDRTFTVNYADAGASGTESTEVSGDTITLNVFDDTTGTDIANTLHSTLNTIISSDDSLNGNYSVSKNGQSLTISSQSLSLNSEGELQGVGTTGKVSVSTNDDLMSGGSASAAIASAAWDSSATFASITANELGTELNGFTIAFTNNATPNTDISANLVGSTLTIDADWGGNGSVGSGTMASITSEQDLEDYINAALAAEGYESTINLDLNGTAIADIDANASFALTGGLAATENVGAIGTNATGTIDFTNSSVDDLAGTSVMIDGKEVEFYDSSKGTYTSTDGKIGVDLKGAENGEAIVQKIVDATNDGAGNSSFSNVYATADGAKLVLTAKTAGENPAIGATGNNAEVQVTETKGSYDITGEAVQSAKGLADGEHTVTVEYKEATVSQTAKADGGAGGNVNAGADTEVQVSLNNTNTNLESGTYRLIGTGTNNEAELQKQNADGSWTAVEGYDAAGGNQLTSITASNGGVAFEDLTITTSSGYSANDFATTSDFVEFQIDAKHYEAKLTEANGSAGDAVRVESGAEAITLKAADGLGEAVVDMGTFDNIAIGSSVEWSFSTKAGEAAAASSNAETGGTFTAKFQIGANKGQSIQIDVNDMRSVSLGISGTEAGAGHTAVEGAKFTEVKSVTNGTNNDSVEFALDVSTHESATAAIEVLDNAINAVSAERSKLGAYQNRLDHTINNLGTSSENLTAAESRIRDVDYALAA